MIELHEGETIYGRAADEIEGRGWVQGAFERGGKVCLLGGVQCAIWGFPVGASNLYTYPAEMEDDEAGWAMYANVVCGLATRLNDIPATWNDRDERTQEDVVGMLRELHEEELANA